MINVAVLRTRKGVKGVGRKIASLFGGTKCEVTCGFRPKNKLEEGAVVINYGRSEWPIWWRDDLKIVNSPDAVAVCANKIKCFKALNEFRVPTLEWTEDEKVAWDWLEEGKRVYARTLLTSRRGRGIVIVHPGPPEPILTLAPLYTKAFPLRHEFRVFVAGGKAIDLVQKKRMGEDKLRHKGLAEADEDVRSYHKGWVFAHKNLNLGPKGRGRMEQIALDAVRACGLDYAAVDMLYAGRGGPMVVCEVNSAPEMRRSQTTWGAWEEYFKGVANG